MDRYGVALLLLSLSSSDAYKFLVYSPLFGYSHTHFMGAIADILTEAGHDVVILMPTMDPEEEHRTDMKLATKIIKTPINPRVEEIMRYKSIRLNQMWTMQPTAFRLTQVVPQLGHHYEMLLSPVLFRGLPLMDYKELGKSQWINFMCTYLHYNYLWLNLIDTTRSSSFLATAENVTASFAYLCDDLISDDALMKRLADEEFDVGIAEAFSICGLGIFEILKIPSSISTFSGVHSDITSNSIGEPITPSYVPGEFDKQRRTNFR